MPSNRVNDIFSEFIYKRTYSRYLPEKDRRETWEETVDRYFEFFLPRVPAKLQKTYLRAKPFILNHKTMPSMRSLWAAGPALDADNLAGYNCASLNVDSIKAFPEMLYVLMNGAGCGFSVERQVVSKLPDVPSDLKYGEEIIKFEDSKLGWAEGFERLLINLYDGKLTMCDYSLIRPEGARLKTFGGRSSGKFPLERLVKFTIQTFEGAKGRKLNSLECHDLMCYIASIVIAGGVRRSSTISLSNLSDQRMQTCKTGSFWNTYPHRALANNSVAYTEKPDMSQFMKEWERLMLSQSGERGIFNREAAIKQMISSGRRKPDKSVLCNPCQPQWATILTNQGVSTIGKLMVGDKIWSKEGWTTVLKKWSTGTKEVYRYRTSYGVFYGTEKHRVVNNGVKTEVGKSKAIDRLIGDKHEGFHTTTYTSSDPIYIENKQIELSAKGIESIYAITDLHKLRTVESIEDITSNIIQTSYTSTEEVFDITVDNDSHTYWSGGCDVSNCSEILLKPSQTCNLSEVIVRTDDTLADLTEKIKYATILGVLQSTLTDFNYLRPEWKINCDEERLLGVSLTGIMDHPVLSDESNPERMNDWLTTMKDTAIKVAKKWCKALDINMSAAITTVKPSGTVSLLCNTASGIHPRFSNYYIRRVRVSRVDPISKYMIDKGVPYDVEGDSMVFAFPIEAPKNSVFRDDKTALQQLEHWKIVQESYCEHKPSITVYVREHEWLEVGAWVYKHFDIISGVSFLPYDNGIYKLAPYEAITEEEYTKLESEFPTFDFKGLSEYEHEDNTEGAKTLACSGSSCEI